MTLPKIKAVITDWDDTITNKDTIQLVAEAAYITKPDFPKQWDYFSDVYYSKYRNFLNEFGERRTIEDEKRYQDGLKEIEMSSVNSFVNYGLFKDVKLETLINQTNKVEIKPGFFDIFKKLYENDIPVYILSCNWTSLIMERIFKEKGFKANDNFKFITNEFLYEDNKLTGKVDNIRDIRTGIDKVNEVNIIKNELKSRNIIDSIYYFGDSGTDILPMLEVDYGIVLDNGSALKTLENLKIPYDNGLQGTSKIKHIKNWSEINELV